MKQHKIRQLVRSNLTYASHKFIQVEPCGEVMLSHFSSFTTKCVKHLVVLSA